MASTILIKVHRVLDGPYEDEDGNYWLNCRVEDPQERNPSNKETRGNDHIKITLNNSAPWPIDV